MIVIKITVVTEVVIMTSFSKKHLNTLTTDQLSGQLFATLAMFIGDNFVHFLSPANLVAMPFVDEKASRERQRETGFTSVMSVTRI